MAALPVLSDDFVVAHFIVSLADSWIIINLGGGPTDDEPGIPLETPHDRDRASSFLSLRVAASTVGTTSGARVERCS